MPQQQRFCVYENFVYLCEYYIFNLHRNQLW